MPTGKTVPTANAMMSAPPITVPETFTLASAARLMTEKNIGCLPVVGADGRLVGMLTERMFQALLSGGRPANSLSFEQRTVLELYSGRPRGIAISEQAFQQLSAREVREVMFRDPATVRPDAPSWAVADRMLQAHVSHITVVDDGRPVGVIARHDLLKTIAASP